MTDDWISTKEAMGLLGVGSTTIKRWADEEILPSIRTAGGHRRFRRSIVMHFRTQGLVLEHDLNEIDMWVNLFFSNNDVPFITNQITELWAETSDWYQVAELLGEVVHRIGEQWEEGDFGIAEEHLISKRFQRALELLTESIPVPRESPNCVLATLSGERHTLGLSLAQLCMREAGYETFWVGADTPADALCDLIKKLTPNVVMLSASSWSTDRRFLAESHQLISATCRKLNTELIIGGAAPWPEDLEYGYRCESFADLKQTLSQY